MSLRIALWYLLCMTSDAALGAELTVIHLDRPDVSGTYVSLSGDIRVGDWSKFFRIVRGDPTVTGIMLTSTGGSADDGLAIAKYVNEHHFDTMTNATCHSVCALIFLAGEDRYLTVDAVLTVHNAYKVLGDWAVTDHQANGTVAWFLGHLGYPLELARLWLTTPSEEMAPITLDMNERLDLGFTIIK